MRTAIISVLAVLVLHNTAFAQGNTYNNCGHEAHQIPKETPAIDKPKEIECKTIIESIKNTYHSSSKNSSRACSQVKSDYLIDIVKDYFYSDKYIAAWGEPKSVWTKRMQILFEKDRKNADKTGLGNLDFDFPSNSQDPDVKNLAINVYKSNINGVEVKATFKQWKKDMDIRYKFICNGKTYLLDEVESLSKGNSWVLSEILSGGV